MSDRVPCPYCDKDYANRGGLHKHLAKYHLEEQSLEKPADQEEEVLQSTQTVEESEWIEPEPETSISEEDSGTAWMDYTGSISSEEETTDHIPTMLKFKPQSKSHKLDKKNRRQIDYNLLMAGYGAGDLLLSKYANAITAGEIKEVRHSNADKNFTANITLDWMDESGITLSDKISTGVLAAGANAMFFGGPIIRVQKKAATSPLKQLRKRFSLRKLWPFGKKKRKNQQSLVPQEVSEEEQPYGGEPIAL